MPSQVKHIDIPILPHVKDLLLSLYGSEPIHASENNLPGKELQFFFMSTKRVSQDRINGAKLSITISHRLAPYYFKFSNAFNLGCYFEKQFNMLLFTHIEAQLQCGMPIIGAIKSFFYKYNIDSEFYSYQRALEAYRRIKSRITLVRP